MRRLALAVAFALAGFAPAVASAQPGALPVLIASSSDTSPGALDARARTQHGEVVRRALGDVLRRSGSNVRPGRRLDVAVVAWRVTPADRSTDVAVELRVVIAEETGRMLSILVGRATVSADKRTPIAELREQAIAEAIRGMQSSLQSQLARSA